VSGSVRVNWCVVIVCVVCVLCGVQSTLVVRLVCVSFVNMYGLALQLCVYDGLCVCVCVNVRCRNVCVCLCVRQFTSVVCDAVCVCVCQVVH